MDNINSTNYDIAFIVTVYNKEKYIHQTLECIQKVMRNTSHTYQVIVCNDASTDNSLDEINIFLDLPNFFLINNKVNLGFAETYFKGVYFSNSRYIQSIQGDNVITSDALSLIIEKLHTAPVIVHSHSNSKERFFLRYLLSEFFTQYLNFILSKNLKYYNGFNIYESESLKKLCINNSSFSFQCEVLRQMLKTNKYCEVVTHTLYRDDSSSAITLKNILGVGNYLLNLTVRRFTGQL